MALVSWCPQCFSPVSGATSGFSCDQHGVVVPLWRAVQVDYAAFSEVVALAAGLPTYLPWPLSPGWTVADVACVASPPGSDRGDPDAGPDGPEGPEGREGRGLATVSTTVGTSSLDGEVSVTVVTEEPGVGLGARIARTGEIDPGGAIGSGPPAVRLRIGPRPVPLWPVPSGESDDLLARAVFAGESGGRWLWLVMSPAPAALLLRDDWLFADAGAFGPEAVEIPFGGTHPGW